MTWFAVDDRFWSHPKVLRLRSSPRYGDAVALWTLAGSWCAVHAWEDGIISADTLDVFGLADWPESAAALVAAGLWQRSPAHGPASAFAFHDWPDWNGPDAKTKRIDRRLAQDRERQRRRRDNLRQAERETASKQEQERIKKARWRARRCAAGEHSSDCPRGCPVR